MASEPNGGTVTYDDYFAARIDDLVESALKEQAREQQMLIDTVHGAQKEMKALRELIEKRDSSVVDLLEARLSGLSSEQTQTAIAAGIEELVEGPKLAETIAPITHDMQELSQKLDSMGSRLKALEEGIGRVDPWKPASEVQRGLMAKLGEVALAIRESIEDGQRGVTDKVGEGSEQILEDLGKRWGGVSEQVREAGEDLRGRFREASVALAQQFREGSSSISERIGEMSEGSAAIKEEVARSSASLVEAIEAVRSLTGESKEAILQAKGDLKLGIEGSGARTFDRVVKLTSTAEELTEGIAGLNRRLEEAFGEVESTSRARAAALSRQVEGLKETVVNEGAELTTRVEDVKESVASEASELAVRMDDHAAQASKTLFDAMEGFHRALVEQTDRTVGFVSDSVAPTAAELHKLGGRLKDSNRRITEANSRVEALFESLLRYLLQRDEYLERTRDRVLVDLVEQMGDSLKRRDRVRLSESLRTADAARRDRRDARAYRKMMGDSEPVPDREELTRVSREIAKVASRPAVAAPKPTLQPAAPVPRPERTQKTPAPKKKVTAKKRTAKPKAKKKSTKPAVKRKPTAKVKPRKAKPSKPKT